VPLLGRKFFALPAIALACVVGGSVLLAAIAFVAIRSGPTGGLEVRRLALHALAGQWQSIVDDAPAIPAARGSVWEDFRRQVEDSRRALALPGGVSIRYALVASPVSRRDPAHLVVVREVADPPGTPVGAVFGDGHVELPAEADASSRTLLEGIGLVAGALLVAAGLAWICAPLTRWLAKRFGGAEGSRFDAWLFTAAVFGSWFVLAVGAGLVVRAELRNDAALVTLLLALTVPPIALRGRFRRTRGGELAAVHAMKVALFVSLVPIVLGVIAGALVFWFHRPA
jgi:hypothetical protein